jgi:hypothetical protein
VFCSFFGGAAIGTTASFAFARFSFLPIAFYYLHFTSGDNDYHSH